MLESNNIYLGDSRELLKQIDDNSIDMVLTSPPYDNLRTYNGTLEWSFEIFQDIAKELVRVLKDGGIIVWVVADATINGSETGTSFRQALYFKELGLNIHDTMIWESEKIPLNHNRYEQSFEYMFCFSKGKPKTFNPIMVDCKKAGRKNSGQTFRHTNEVPRKAHKETNVKMYKIKQNVWFYQVGYMHSSKDKLAFKHPAIFPEQLAHDHIISWSNENDIILDPFVGSGTTCKVSYDLKRQYIGIEKVKEYYDIACERLQNAKAQLRLF